MTKEEIVFEWLCIDANRNRLVKLQVSEFELNVFNTICTMHVFGEYLRDKVYELPSGECITLIVKE